MGVDKWEGEVTKERDDEMRRRKVIMVVTIDEAMV